jgi:hypothetical protein
VRDHRRPDDLVDRTDPRERLLGLGVIRHRFFEAAIDVSPAIREHDSRTFSRARLMRTEIVADDRAVIAADEILEGRGALVITDSVHDDARRGETPHLPLLRAATVEARPAGLIESDHWLREHELEECGVVDALLIPRNSGPGVDQGSGKSRSRICWR